MTDNICDKCIYNKGMYDEDKVMCGHYNAPILLNDTPCDYRKPMTDKMTIEQAIKVLKNLEMQLACESFTKALGVAIEALEKQIPKEPVAGHKVASEKFKHYAECPNCRKRVSEHRWDNDGYSIDKYYRWCLNCGQKLDWESDIE